MDETVETKTCPFCAETIKSAAKKCPYCNSRLFRFALWRQELTIGFGIFIWVALFIFCCVEMFPEDPLHEGRSFVEHRQELMVTNITVGVENRGTNDFYYNISGVVTNVGEYPWRVRDFELTVLNVRGTTDVRHEHVEDHFVVQPHSEHAFVFHSYTILTNPVVGVRIRVENALDGNISSSDH